MTAPSAVQTASPPKTSRVNVVFRGLPYKLHRTTFVKLKNSRICGRSGMKNLKKEGRERLQRRNDMEKEDLNY